MKQPALIAIEVGAGCFKQEIVFEKEQSGKHNG